MHIVVSTILCWAQLVENKEGNERMAGGGIWCMRSTRARAGIWTSKRQGRKEGRMGGRAGSVRRE
jgi:hypothetical protein